MTWLDNAGPQLAGVLHAGGVLQDALVPNQTAGGMRAVFAPKVNGTENIGRYACHAPLAAVNLFSSVAASLGSGGQANYAAANSVMDSWSHHQQVKVLLLAGLLTPFSFFCLSAGCQGILHLQYRYSFAQFWSRGSACTTCYANSVVNWWL